MEFELVVDLALDLRARTPRKAKLPGNASHASDHGSLLRGIEHAGHGARVALPRRRLFGEPLTPFARDLVVLRAPIVVRRAPLADEQAARLEAMQRLIE